MNPPLKFPWITALAFVLALGSGPALAHELSGYVGGQLRLFPNDPLYEGQREHTASLVAQPEYYHEFEDGSSLTFVPFYRLDSSDSERTHFDIREMTFLWLKDDFELRAGVRKVFWGATEVFHLVNIINQVDLVENFDFEDYLGQPMVNLSFVRDWGVVDLFYLPWFRERTFPGAKGRLRGALKVDTDRARFESASENWHTDWAVRYSQVFGDWDVGVHHFYGTGREPTLVADVNGNGDDVFVPFYEQIHQTGTDLSFVAGDWLWKFEGFHRMGQGQDFFAWTGGFEYTFTGILDTAMDLGVVGEWMWDERGRNATFAFENDAALALRLTFNDADSSEALLGWVQDVDTDARFLFVETSRRFGDRIRATLELRAFVNQPPEDFFFQQRNDDLLQFELEYYF